MAPLSKRGKTKALTKAHFVLRGSHSPSHLWKRLISANAVRQVCFTHRSPKRDLSMITARFLTESVKGIGTPLRRTGSRESGCILERRFCPPPSPIKSFVSSRELNFKPLALDHYKIGLMSAFRRFIV